MLQSAADHYTAQLRLVGLTTAAIRREWSSIGEDFDAGWARVGHRIVALMTAAQVGAARDGAAYVAAALAEQGIHPDVLGEVNPVALAGAYDAGGMMLGSLDSVAYGAVVRARSGSAESLGDRLARGRSWLDMLTVTQVADAGRAGTGAAIAVRPHVGWTRMVNPGCCKRCAVLAGIYSAEIAFDRHPGCLCRAVPTDSPDRGGLVDSVKPYQVRDLTKAQRQAIADGADMVAVINSDRGRSADGMWTTEGTTKRAYATRVRREVARLKQSEVAWTSTNVGRRGAVENYAVRRLGPRPTPAAIYRYAPSREEAVRILHAQGYVVGDFAAVARVGAGI